MTSKATVSAIAILVVYALHWTHIGAEGMRCEYPDGSEDSGRRALEGRQRQHHDSTSSVYEGVPPPGYDTAGSDNDSSSRNDGASEYARSITTDSLVSFLDLDVDDTSLISMQLILALRGFHACSGTLIAPDVVLTTDKCASARSAIRIGGDASGDGIEILQNNDSFFENYTCFSDERVYLLEEDGYGGLTVPASPSYLRRNAESGLALVKIPKVVTGAWGSRPMRVATWPDRPPPMLSTAGWWRRTGNSGAYYDAFVYDASTESSEAGATSLNPLECTDVFKESDCGISFYCAPYYGCMCYNFLEDDPAFCDGFSPNNPQWSNGALCIESNWGAELGYCNGDVGSPLLLSDGSTGVAGASVAQVGVAMQGHQFCPSEHEGCPAGAPSRWLYAPITTSVLEWIQQTVCTNLSPSSCNSDGRIGSNTDAAPIDISDWTESSDRPSSSPTVGSITGSAGLTSLPRKPVRPLQRRKKRRKRRGRRKRGKKRANKV